jgi:hypothetical protein
MSIPVEYLLTVNAEQAETDLRKIETMIIKLTDYIRRLSGDENLDNLMLKIQQTINYLRVLQVTITAVQAALIPGAGWMKAAWAGFAIANVGFTGYDMIRGY